MKLARLLIVLFLLFLPVACKKGLPTTGATFSNPDGTSSPKLTLEVANTQSSRKLGLMYRKEMAENSGMLFVFLEEEDRSFWMKNTYLELDIIYLNAAKEVVSIAKRSVPHSLKRRKSAGPSKYVVEILGGLSDKWKIQAGSKLNLDKEL